METTIEQDLDIIASMCSVSFIVRGDLECLEAEQVEDFFCATRDKDTLTGQKFRCQNSGFSVDVLDSESATPKSFL